MAMLIMPEALLGSCENIDGGGGGGGGMARCWSSGMTDAGSSVTVLVVMMMTPLASGL